MVLVVGFDDAQRSVVVAFTEGDREAFRDLYLKYKDRVYAVLCKYVPDRETALDLLQDTFLRVHEYREKVRAEDEFHKLLTTIAVNAAIDWLRRNKRLRTVSIDVDGPVAWNLADGRADFTRALERGEVRRDVDAALAQCPAHERAVLALRLAEGITYEEAAARLDISARTAKRHAKSGLARMGRILAARGYAVPAPGKEEVDG